MHDTFVKESLRGLSRTTFLPPFHFINIDILTSVNFSIL